MAGFVLEKMGLTLRPVHMRRPPNARELVNHLSMTNFPHELLRWMGVDHREDFLQLHERHEIARLAGRGCEISRPGAEPLRS